MEMSMYYIFWHLKGQFTVQYQDEIITWDEDACIANGYTFDQLYAALPSEQKSEARGKSISPLKSPALTYLNGYLPSSDVLWTPGRVGKNKETKENDEKGVKLMLQILNEPISLKLYRSGNTRGLWVKIAEGMQAVGFNLGERVKAREKVNNKYNTLRTNYRKYKASCQATGTDRKEPPEFYDEVAEIEGDTHATCPPVVLDSLSKKTVPTPEPDQAQAPSLLSVDRKRSFKNVSSKPGLSGKASVELKGSQNISVQYDPETDILDVTAEEEDIGTVHVHSSSSSPEICEVNASPVSSSNVKSKIGRNSAKKEVTKFMDKHKETQDKNDEFRLNAMSFLASQSERIEKREKQREQELKYRHERDEKILKQGEMFLTLFQKYVEGSQKKDQKDKDRRRRSRSRSRSPIN